MNILSREVLSRAENLETHEEYLNLLGEIRGRIGDVSAEDLVPSLESVDPNEQATAFLACAAWSLKPSNAAIEGALRQESSILVAAATLCAVACFGEEEAFVRKLLLGPDKWHPSEISRNARHFLILAMGTSGETRFAKLLDEARDHSHFCLGPTVARALALLDSELPTQNLDEEELPYFRSLSITEGLDGIIINTDEQYGGGSNCIHCRFFPCRINHYYSEGIEDCRLWNKIDPSSLGEIIDQRKMEEPHEVDQPKHRPAEKLLRMAKGFLKRGEAATAIPILCEVIIDSEFKDSRQPVVWINLARCFSASGERLLEFIVLREGARLQNLLGLAEREEREELDRFVNDPEAVFGRRFPRDRRLRFGLRAQGYKKANLYTQALDCYAQGLICQGGDSGGVWFQMGECFRALGELWLSELFACKAASLSEADISLREKFLATAAAVRGERRGNDPGLAIERRRADRAQSDPPDLCIVDPVDDPEDLPAERPWWMDRKRGWHARGVGDFFEESKRHCLAGDLETAIKILEWGRRYSLEAGSGGVASFDRMIEILRNQ
jgi:hypothetical protein